MPNVNEYTWVASPFVIVDGTVELAGPGDINGLSVAQRVHLTLTATVQDADTMVGGYVVYPYFGDAIMLAFPNAEFGAKVGRPEGEWPGAVYPSGGADQLWDEGAEQTGLVALNDVMGGDDEDPANWTGNFVIVRIPCWTMVLLRTAELTVGNEHTLDVYWTLDSTTTSGELSGTSNAPTIGSEKGSGGVPQVVQTPVGSSGGAGGVLDILNEVIAVAREGRPGVTVVSSFRPGEVLPSGQLSDHAFNTPLQAARDIGFVGVDALVGPPPLALDEAIVDVGAYFGRSYSGGTEIIDTFEWNGLRVQIIWRTPLYGGHMGHIHVGIRTL